MVWGGEKHEEEEEVEVEAEEDRTGRTVRTLEANKLCACMSVCVCWGWGGLPHVNKAHSLWIPLRQPCNRPHPGGL